MGYDISRLPKMDEGGGAVCWMGLLKVGLQVPQRPAYCAWTIVVDCAGYGKADLWHLDPRKAP